MMVGKVVGAVVTVANLSMVVVTIVVGRAVASDAVVVGTGVLADWVGSSQS